jgi:hypothetical protein
VYELVPILGGLLAGLVIGRTVAPWPARLGWLLGAAVLIGVAAGLLSGELKESWAFLAIDIPGALIAGAVAIFTLDRLAAPAAARRGSD